MNSQKQSSHYNNITSICNETRSSRAQITYLSVKNAPVMILHDHILLALDYIQILTPILFLTLSFQKAQETGLSTIIVTIARLLNAVSWLDFTKIESFEITILCIIGLFMILKYLLFLHIFLLIKGKVKKSKLLLQLWRYLFRTQGRIIYFFVSSFWVKAINVISMTKDERSDSNYYGLMIFFSIMMTLEFCFSLYLNIFYVDILPSKQFLSAKDNTIEIIGLVQKLVIQILLVALDFTQLSNLWIFTLMNAAIDVVRNNYFYRKLPFYSFKTHFYHGTLLMIVSSLNISCLMTTLIKSIDTEYCSLIFVIITWVILAVLNILFSHSSLKKEIWDILLNPSLQSPNKLIHRIRTTIELRGMTEKHFDFNKNYSWTMLANQAINLKIKEIFKIDPEDDSILDINDKESFNQILSKYLQKLMEIYPKNQFLKLYTAYFYAKKLKLIRRPIDILTKLQGNSSLQISLNSELLLMEIQNTLNNKFANPKEDHLDLTKFIHEKTLYLQAREKIISQADLQIKICKEIKKESPNLSLIFNESQKLAYHRLKTKKFLKNTLNLMSDHHIEPLLLYARYHLVLNHSMNENTQYTKLYNKKLQKYHQYFEKEELVQENMFSQDISFTIFSCNEATIGKVFYASKQLTKMLGRNNDSILAMNIIKNAPPCFRESFVEYYKLVARQGETSLRDDSILRGFICDSDHYLIEIDYYIDIHPFVTSEFYVNFIQRVVKSSNKDFMLVLENGDIDCTSRRIAERLSLFPSSKSSSPGTNFNIKDISEELMVINDAFNLVFFDNEGVKRPSFCVDQAISKAKEIYSVYTTEGQDIVVKSLRYNCKVANIFLGKSLLKLFTFEERNFETKKKLNSGGDPTPVSCVNEPQFDKETHDESATADVAAEEKDEGWIDFEAMIPHENYLGTNRTTTVMETQRGQETFRNLLKPRGESSESQKVEMKSKFSADSTGGRNCKQTERNTLGNQRESRLSIATSKWSKFSHQKRVSYLYEISLNTRYSPKLYKFLFCLFFAAFILLTFSQFFLKSTLDNNIEELRASKDVLRNAQLRNYLQVMIEFTARMLWDYKSGTLPSSTLGIFAYAVSSFSPTLKNYLLQLGESNRNLLSNSSTLDEEIRDQLFAIDVKMYETYFDDENQTYTTLNNFQAIDNIVETGLRMTSPGGMDDFETTEVHSNFLLRNCFNDLLIKNKEISKQINNALDLQRKDIENAVRKFLVMLLIIFGGLAIFVIYILWQQYKKKIKSLSAFCRVNSNRFDEVLNEFIRFKQHIEDEEVDYHHSESTSLYSAKRERMVGNMRGNTRDLDCWDLQKGFYISVGKLAFLILGIMSTIIVTSVLNRSSIKSSKTTQGQIYFLDHVKARTGVTSGSLLELISTNNTAFVEGKLVLEKLESLTVELENIRIEITKTLLDRSQGQDSAHIETILYGEACSALDQATAGSCYILANRGYKTGFVYILSSYSEMVSGAITKYKGLNKTEEALQEMKKEYFERLVLLQQVIRMELAEMADFIDEKFEEDLDYTHKERSYIVIGHVLLIVFVSFLVWRVVLKRFGEGINEFKNVLSVLPGDLVLTSFLLRNFLLKTSKGVLDPIKTDF